jgi:bifunctional DNA-binding transcriptional regulator/antitoxin component of YhaV-PrlF toxin-antitoxin module
MEVELQGVIASSTLSQKGWLVIPQEFRRRHRMKKGDKLRLIDCGTFIAIVPPGSSPIARGLSSLPYKMAMTDELIESRLADLVREERDLPPPRRD